MNGDELPIARETRPARPRRFLQFRLKWLLVFVAVLAAPLSWLGWKLEEKRRERWAEGELERYCAYLYVSDDALSNNVPPGPLWLRRLLGDDFFLHVSTVECRSPELARRENVGPAIDDAGLIYLRYLPRLRTLYLAECRVTDAGLSHLRPLKGLESLDLRGTEVSEAAVAELRKALPNCEIQR